MINDERRYVRHVDFTGPKGERVQTKLVYDYRECTAMLNTVGTNGNAVGPLDS